MVMKKRILVGVKEVNKKYKDESTYLYQYKAISNFVKSATHLGLKIRYMTHTHEYISPCIREAYSVVFEYKFKERRKFKELFSKLTTDTEILKWFSIVIPFN